MKRRPKLHLSPDTPAHKQRPAGFDSDKPAGNSAQTAKRPSSTQAGATPEAASETPASFAQNLMEGLGLSAVDSRKLLKAAMITAAVGLSLYLLKRRFF